jgi:hypothetical protein
MVLTTLVTLPTWKDVIVNIVMVRKSVSTRSFPPKKIAVCWKIESLSVALKLERAIKKPKKELKKKLVDEPKNLQKIISLDEFVLIT